MAAENKQVSRTLPRCEHVLMSAGSHVTATTEVARKALGWTWLEHLGRDLRYAIRGLRKSPVFAAVAVVSLALGIGANTAMFSINDALRFRTLAVRQPEELVRVTRSDNTTQSRDQFTYAQFLEIRSSSAFAAVTVATHLDRSNVTASGPSGGFDPSVVHVELVRGTTSRRSALQREAGRLFER